ncbi:MAG: dienelactone hydrolase family protein [Verrucomicrobia bacterium]|nr:dienelactone hydrolase family protein [Verrucomicrobiota bacterium]
MIFSRKSRVSLLGLAPLNGRRCRLYTAAIPYQDNGVELEGFAAYAGEDKRPLAILCHAWRGRDEFICGKAKEIAGWGYHCFALDMYGKGVLGNTKEENAALKRPFVEDRSLLQRRVVKGFEVAAGLPHVDADRIAVLGMGFGGGCAIDLARSGVNLKGAVSIYGHFAPPPAALVKAIKAKVLILHGYKDPVADQEELRAFEKEMDVAKVDWQVHVYGSAMHAFANPGANDPQSGMLYSPKDAERAWKAARNFLDELFA